MGFIQFLTARYGVVRELLAFFWRNKWSWLVPMIGVLLLLAVLLVLAQTYPIGPFIYTLL